MKNTIIHIVGFPGSGKYTIAKEICALADVRLVDNHLINIPLFSLIKQDGATPLPPRIWENVGKIWDAVLDTMVHISPPEYNFVLTNALSNEGETDKEWSANVQRAAQERGGVFIPVRLVCSVEENEKRIVSPERKNRMKETNPASPRRNAENYTVLKTGHPHELTLDVSDISAREAAQRIIAHVKICGV